MLLRRVGGRLAMLFTLVVGGTVESVRGRSSSPEHLGSNCTVCRGVTQGFVDLHTEWPFVRKMEAAATRGGHELGGAPLLPPRGTDAASSVTYEASIERFCAQSFLTGNQQRVCYSITPFAAEVARWLRMGVPPERVCLKLGKRNPDTCFDGREAERPGATLSHWRNRPTFIPEGVACSLEHRNSFEPRWVLLD